MNHYRLATIQVFDVLDVTMVSATIYEYNGTPGVIEPTKHLLSAVRKRTDHLQPDMWLWDAIQELQATIDEA
jgi:hypothetical protein